MFLLSGSSTSSSYRNYLFLLASLFAGGISPNAQPVSLDSMETTSADITQEAYSVKKQKVLKWLQDKTQDVDAKMANTRNFDAHNPNCSTANNA